MGLITDYVEANRERVRNGDIDPCMIVNPDHTFRLCYASLHETMREYDRPDNDAAHRKLLEIELRKRIDSLDIVKAHYILTEKALLEVINRCQLKSSMVSDSLKELCSQVREAYRSVCGILQELNGRLKGGYTYQAPEVSESAVRLRLLKLLMNCIVCFINDDTTMDTSIFRKVISDCALLIRVLEDELYHQSDKKVVENYMVRRLSITKGTARCPSCRELLYSGIPYCLNCYIICSERTRNYE